MLVDIKKDGVNYFGISESVAISKGLLVEYEQGKQAQLLKLAQDNRKYAYVLESDPLYMEWQYDQTPEKEQAWRDKVAEIKARYPLPSEF
ncbi:hypothetical protein [Vibrio parahaemolyticus]|uniref:hypothetical protein n=1 Tax=Vibrio parahaemolyticus TaxID=670 RepID=UPI00112483E3|nr:hypothetical protein [Vibrio parahaemolyticus]TPA69929.1 hypothetical protein DXJ77_23435 [Vibrio parahaemolyticus]